ncbi:MAG: hypothetical protein R3242_10965 [Akkermansiaceae bacterium]|nr:hypothetical protein [Akkermansiaceae bacterium]
MAGLNAHDSKSVKLLTRVLIFQWILLGMYLLGYALVISDYPGPMALLYAPVIAYLLCGPFIAIFTLMEWNVLTTRCQKHCIIHHVAYVVILVFRTSIEHHFMS